MKGTRIIKRRGLTITALAVLFGISGTVCVSGLRAYLTDQETSYNIITAGDVKIDLIEPGWPGNSSPDVKNLAPMQKIPKDPSVVNTGSNDAIVLVRMEVPTRQATPVDENGDRVPVSSNIEVFSLYDTVPGPNRLLSEQEVGSDETPYSRDGWVLLNKTDSGTGLHEYLYAYDHVLVPETSEGQPEESRTSTLFDLVQFNSVVEGDISEDDRLDIGLTAYAIQADSILDNNDLDLTKRLTPGHLMEIYNIWINQNLDGEIPQAQGNNSYDIPQ